MEMNASRPPEIAPEPVEVQLIDAIRDHPWIAVLGAAALGFVVARLVRGER